MSNEVKNTIKDFVNSDLLKKQYSRLDNKQRKQLHLVCKELQFGHESTGQNNNRVFEISVKNAENKTKVLKEYTLTEWTKKNENGHNDGRGSSYKMNKISKMYCCDCGKTGDECDIGFARDGSIMCYECYEEDPELSNYKWELASDCC